MRSTKQSRTAITSSRIKAIDANCEYLGLRGLQLMENAGASIARKTLEMIDKGTIAIVAGRGNNGGDAFVAARHLAERSGLDIRVILAGKGNEIRTRDARLNFNILSHTSISSIMETKDPIQIRECGWIEDADVIIDGLLGTGVKGNIREPESTIIDLINSADAKVICVDVPSGLDPDGGAFEKAVRGNVTLTFHRAKTGLTDPRIQEYIGKLEVVNIGVCKDAMLYVGAGDLKVLSRHHKDSHKGQGGRVLIIGGGPYTGAPALSGLAALRSGADIVTIATPESSSEIIASFSPNLIVRKLSAPLLCEEDIPYLQDLVKDHDVVVIGMGLGRDRQTLSAISQIIPFCEKVVVDADGLRATDLPMSPETTAILTPHAGEFSMLKEKAAMDGENNMGTVMEFSKRNNVITLLKGSEDIISDGEMVRLNRTGNPGMTVGGTGDVLAGITGAMLCKNDAMLAASCAAFINGLAGDLAYQEKREGLLATDIIEMIPRARKYD